MRSRLRVAVQSYPDVSAEQLDRLEHDLHVACPSFADNREMLAALIRTRCTIISSKHILHQVGGLPASDPFMREHDRVLAALQKNDATAAAAALLAHLRSAREKVSSRLRTFRLTQSLPALPYIGPRKAFVADEVAGSSSPAAEPAAKPWAAE
jgi:DNA-binding GntR family transcriptional regulator